MLILGSLKKWGLKRLGKKSGSQENPEDFLF
ncbi:MAG: hypothetical protein ACJAUJ_000074 [Salibacteraceae bacterium]